MIRQTQSPEGVWVRCQATLGTFKRFANVILRRKAQMNKVLSWIKNKLSISPWTIEFNPLPDIFHGETWEPEVNSSLTSASCVQVVGVRVPTDCFVKP